MGEDNYITEKDLKFSENIIKGIYSLSHKKKMFWIDTILASWPLYFFHYKSL